MLSLQLGGVPGVQPPAGLQTSTPLQNCPSLQLDVSVCTHSFRSSSQRSVVQVFLSLHRGGLPGTHPSSATHFSFPSQNRPLLQRELRSSWTQALACPSQKSRVQSMKSSQVGGTPSW